MTGVRYRAGVAALVLLTAACGGAEAPQRDPSDGETLGGYGLTITVPPGWEGRISRGAIRLANRSVPTKPGPLALEPGDLVVYVLEREPSPDEWAGVDADAGPPTLATDDFEAPESGTAPERHGVAHRFVSMAGRVFVVYGEAGARPVSEDTIAEANAGLRTLEVEPGDFYPGAVAPATFAPAPGWHTGDSGHFERRPWGEQTQSWAATVPYADGPFDVPPRKTIDQLPENGVLVQVALSRAWAADALSARYPVHERPYQLAQFDVNPVWEGQVGDVPEYELLTRVPDQYEVEARIYFGRPIPTPAMRAAAEAELERLRLPDWGPFELE